jgi:hypothetical protein
MTKLCGESHQLAQILREGSRSHEAQITGTEKACWKAFLDTLVFETHGVDLLTRDGNHHLPLINSSFVMLARP